MLFTRLPTTLVLLSGRLTIGRSFGRLFHQFPRSGRVLSPGRQSGRLPPPSGRQPGRLSPPPAGRVPPPPAPPAGAVAPAAAGPPVGPVATAAAVNPRWRDAAAALTGAVVHETVAGPGRQLARPATVAAGTNAVAAGPVPEDA